MKIFGVTLDKITRSDTLCLRQIRHNQAVVGSSDTEGKAAAAMARVHELREFIGAAIHAVGAPCWQLMYIGSFYRAVPSWIGNLGIDRLSGIFAAR